MKETETKSESWRGDGRERHSNDSAGSSSQPAAAATQPSGLRQSVSPTDTGAVMVSCTMPRFTQWHCSAAAAACQRRHRPDTIWPAPHRKNLPVATSAPVL